jgi:hypothetical protein
MRRALRLPVNFDRPLGERTKGAQGLEIRRSM